MRTLEISVWFLFAYLWIRVEGYPPGVKIREIGRKAALRAINPIPLQRPLPEVTKGHMRLTPVPVLDGPSGRWFFDWFWGPDPGDYPLPPYPQPGPIYPQPGPIYPPQPPPIYPPQAPVHEPLEYCTQIRDPLTGDMIEDCYPLGI